MINIKKEKFLELNEIINIENNRINELKECYENINDIWWRKEISDRLYFSYFNLYLAHLDMYRLSSEPDPIISKDLIELWKDGINGLEKALSHFDIYFPVEL